MVKIIVSFEAYKDDTMNIKLALDDKAGNKAEKAHAQMFMHAIAQGSMKAGADVSEDLE